MHRRNFLRLAGGGAVAVSGAGAAAAITLDSAYPAAAVEAWSGPAATETDPRRRALAYALTAPNPHNLQPWLADLREPGTITLYCDRERLLPHTDPFGRQILIGHGAFLELLVMALAQQGWHADVALWPLGEFAAQLPDWDRRPVARIALARGGRPDPLFAQVLRRHTPKVDFDTARPVSEGALQALLAGAASEGLRIGGTVDPAALPALRDLCWQAAQVELGTPRTVMESIRLTRVGPAEIARHRDGIAINGAVPRIAAALGLFDRSAPPPEGSTAWRQMMARFEGHSRTAMGFLWLATPGNRRRQQLEAGRAYVRLQLQATAAGVGVHPMSQPLQEFAEMAPHHEAAHRLLLGRAAPRAAGDETVQMFCRIGYPAAKVQATPRRPLDQLLRPA
jgi:nitroreductase